MVVVETGERPVNLRVPEMPRTIEHRYLACQRLPNAKVLPAPGHLVAKVEEALVELKLILSRRLRERRARRGLTQAQLARLLKSSQSRVAKMEAGDPSVSLDLLIRSLLAMGATQTELAHVIAKTR